MVTFFEAGTFKHKIECYRKPCVLMVKDINAKSANLHIADPGQTQSPIQVELKIGKKKQVLTADFSQTGIYAGATKQYTVKLQSQCETKRSSMAHFQLKAMGFFFFIVLPTLKTNLLQESPA